MGILGHMMKGNLQCFSQKQRRNSSVDQAYAYGSNGKMSKIIDAKKNGTRSLIQEKKQKDLSVRMENTSSFLMEMEQRRYLPTRQTESKQHRIP